MEKVTFPTFKEHWSVISHKLMFMILTWITSGLATLFLCAMCLATYLEPPAAFALSPPLVFVCTGLPGTVLLMKPGVVLSVYDVNVCFPPNFTHSVPVC